MRVSNTDIDCARASSIGVVNSSSTRFVEIGWYENPIGVVPACPTTSGAPRILVDRLFDGMQSCASQPAITGTPRDDEFLVHDNDQNGVWRYFRDGSFLGSYDMMSFVTGEGRASSERKTGHHDSMYGLFLGLDRMNSSQGWSNWTNTIQLEDSDADYRLCGLPGDDLEMKTGAC